MSRFRLCMLMLVCALSATVPAGCYFGRHLFFKTELPPYDPDFSRGVSVATAGARKATAADAKRPYGAGGRHRWRYIVIHHSATDRGNAEVFDRAHRRHGWDELGYHFVIDNGKGGPDGRVETGTRWVSQKYGAHCGGTPGNEYNSYGIGICLVGSFGKRLPSAAQLAALEKLVTDLAETYYIPARNVISHREAPKARTQCPGDMLHSYIAGHLRARLAQRMASAK